MLTCALRCQAHFIPTRRAQAWLCLTRPLRSAGNRRRSTLTGLTALSRISCDCYDLKNLLNGRIGLAKATIHDVARLAGVSIKTVSRVSNKEANVRTETREKVQRAIDRLEYRPNPSARSLASTRSHVVGLLYDNPSASYLINVQNGALRTSRAEGYDVVIYPCEYQDPGLVNSISSMIRSKTCLLYTSDAADESSRV